MIKMCAKTSYIIDIYKVLTWLNLFEMTAYRYPGTN